VKGAATGTLAEFIVPPSASPYETSEYAAFNSKFSETLKLPPIN